MGLKFGALKAGNFKKLGGPQKGGKKPLVPKYPKIGPNRPRGYMLFEKGVQNELE